MNNDSDIVVRWLHFIRKIGAEADLKLVLIQARLINIAGGRQLIVDSPPIICKTKIKEKKKKTHFWNLRSENLN